MNVTVNQLYREMKKQDSFSMTKDQFLLYLMRKVVDREYGRWQTFRFNRSDHYYLHIDTLLKYFRWYTKRLERKR